MKGLDSSSVNGSLFFFPQHCTEPTGDCGHTDDTSETRACDFRSTTTVLDGWVQCAVCSMQTTACVRVSLPAQEDENAAGRKRLNWVKFMELIKVVLTSRAHVREGFMFSVGEVQNTSSICLQFFQMKIPH